jgi:hypothetical protein
MENEEEGTNYLQQRDEYPPTSPSSVIGFEWGQENGRVARARVQICPNCLLRAD